MKNLYFALITIVLLFSAKAIPAYNSIQYISPLPESKYNSEYSNIIIGYSKEINNSVLKTLSLKVTGSLSGLHYGKIIFTENKTKIVFKPETPFSLGEKVTVSGMKNLDEISFYIRSIKPVLPENFYRNVSFDNEFKNIPFNKDLFIRQDSLPQLTIDSNGTTANGYLFLSNFSNYFNNSILMMLNNNGTPNFARTLKVKAYDFKKQNNNLLTYYYEFGNKFFGLNSEYNIVDSFYTGNGYETDLHELVVTSDGGAWLLSYDPEYIDMSGIVPGGQASALVTGLIIQKINAQKDVVFQWRSWDHFQITDATHEVLTSFNIDYVHANAIEVDYDGNILLSSRHLDEITKINTVTGNIIWRLGGKNNQFQFLNDTIGFSHQHCIRRLSNGNIILFDNGNYHEPSFSRVLEYDIDEVNKTVQIAWEYRHEPSIYAYAMGSVQRLNNGNTLIGWGSAATTLTEVTPGGDVVYELTLPSGQMSYRAFRYDWGIATGLVSSSETSPVNFELFQNYPNPFNPSTIIKYHVNKSGFVSLKVYNILGKEVATLVNEFQNSGVYEKQFDINGITGGNLSSGVYFYRLQTNNLSEVKKMVFIK